MMWLAVNVPVPTQSQWGGIAWVGLIALCAVVGSMMRR